MRVAIFGEEGMMRAHMRTFTHARAQYMPLHPNLPSSRLPARAQLLPTRIILVLEHAPGGSLEDHVGKHGLPTLATLCEWTKDMLRGLEYLHTQGVLHRDIKPSN